MDYEKVVDFIVRVGFPIFLVLVGGGGLGYFIIKYLWPFITKLVLESRAERQRERDEAAAQIRQLLSDRESERAILTSQIQKAEVERLNERVRFNEMLGGLQKTMAEQVNEFSDVAVALSNLTSIISDLKSADERRSRELLEGLEDVRRQLRRSTG